MSLHIKGGGKARRAEKKLAFAVDFEETTSASKKVAILQRNTARFRPPKEAYYSLFFFSLFRISAGTDILQLTATNLNAQCHHQHQ